MGIKVHSRVFSILLELGIMTSHVIWRIRTRKLHAKAKDEGIDFDDLSEAIKYQRSTDRVAKRAVDDVEMADLNSSRSDTILTQKQARETIEEVQVP